MSNSIIGCASAHNDVDEEYASPSRSSANNEVPANLPVIRETGSTESVATVSDGWVDTELDDPNEASRSLTGTPMKAAKGPITGARGAFKGRFKIGQFKGNAANASELATPDSASMEISPPSPFEASDRPFWRPNSMSSDLDGSMEGSPERKQTKSRWSFCIEAIGTCAGLGTTLSFVPQALQIIETGDTSGLSLGMYCMFVGGVFLWVTYGFLKKAPSLVVANLVTALLSGFILSQLIYHSYYQQRSGPSPPPLSLSAAELLPAPPPAPSLAHRSIPSLTTGDAAHAPVMSADLADALSLIRKALEATGTSTSPKEALLEATGTG